MVGSEIIICGKRYDIEHPVVTFEDEGGYNAYIPHRLDNIGEIYASHPAPGLEQRATRYRLRRSMGQTNSLSRLKKVMRQVVIHLDGCMSARMCFHVLHNQRGLSVHFMVDNDGTIYQCLDLVHCAYHAGGVNEVSVGIELQNRGDAARHPNAYAGGRETVTCRIHGAQFLSYNFTDAQYQGMTQLSRTLSRVFEMELTSPSEGKTPFWSTIPRPRTYKGFLGHYHVCAQKWDPGPWDFQRLFRNIGSKVTFPLTPIPMQGKESDLEQHGDRYFENIDRDTEVHFPVGPLGQSRLWHGGVHLKGYQNQAIHAVMRGNIVAARMAPPCPVGSCNFVLIKHRFSMGRENWTFFSLYYHLAWSTEMADSEKSIPWLLRSQGQPWRALLDQGEVVVFKEKVEAGEMIGAMGEAGPSGYRDDQIHFAVFSPTELSGRVDPGYWTIIDERNESRFCSDPRIISMIDRPAGGSRPDGLLSRRELRNFFQMNPKRKETHRMVVRHRSEWTPGGWDRELGKAPDFARIPAARRRHLVAQQVTPTLLWGGLLMWPTRWGYREMDGSIPITRSSFCSGSTH